MQETGEARLQREQVEKQIGQMLEGQKETMGENEYERLRDKFYLAAMAGEKGGFVLGFRYAARLMAECYAGVTVGSE